MLVSFIIPVYNVEKYLRECANSILHQTYRNIEVLLIDDGSSDGCPAICDEYAKKDSRVKAYHKTNGGLSDARNFGLERAKGDYVIFVDSDDFWTDDCHLAELVTELDASPECDFVGFNISYYFERTNTYCNWVAYDENVSGMQPRDEKIRWMVKTGTMPMSACSKIIRRTLLERDRIHFIKGIYSEDIPWFIELLDKCRNFKLVNKYVYAYRQGVIGSITNTFNEKKYNDLFTIVKNGVQTLGDTSFDAETKNAMFSFMAYEYLILLANVHLFEESSYYIELKSYQWLLKYTANPKVKMAAYIYRLLGLKATEWTMRIYMEIRKFISQHK